MRHLVPLLVALAVLWHMWGVVADGWIPASKSANTRDFASYYYAVQVAADGGDPYDKAALARAARQDRTRRAVHPYFYPPPFLLGMLWALPLELVTAYRVWFWLDELAAIGSALILWRWWRPLGPAVPVAIAACFAALTAIPDNHLMGQANLPVLAIALAGLWQEPRRPVLGGALVGVACMLKMSPALFVLWWLIQRRWVAASAAVACAAALTLLSLPLVGPEVQWVFYTEVLPGFGRGVYNGLTVPIDLFGNHSIPNLWNEVWPSPGHALSERAYRASTLSALLLVAGLMIALRRPPPDGLAHAAHVAAIGVAMLLVPVYTYEHHVVWAIPAAVVALVALWNGRLPRWVALPVLLALSAWAWDLSELKQTWVEWQKMQPELASLIRELKFLALIVLLAVSVVVARSGRIEAEGG